MKKHYEKPLSIEELAARDDSEIDTSDIPELDEKFWLNAEISPPQTKEHVSMRLDRSVVDHFKGEDEKGYTSRMAAVLSAYVRAQKAT